MKRENIEQSKSPRLHTSGLRERIIVEQKIEEEHSLRSFRIAPGGITERHSHNWNHEIFVHAGRGQVFQKGEWRDLQSGSAVSIPAHEEHQFMNAGTEDFVFICLAPKTTENHFRDA